QCEFAAVDHGRGVSDAEPEDVARQPTAVLDPIGDLQSRLAEREADHRRGQDDGEPFSSLSHAVGGAGRVHAGGGRRARAVSAVVRSLYCSAIRTTFSHSGLAWSRLPAASRATASW